MGTWDIILVILGSKGSPNRHLKVQVYSCSDFRVILGVSWDPLWPPVCEFSLIWGARMGDWFQVDVFGGSGMEMVLECDGCMCYNRKQTVVFEWFHFFHLFSKLVPWGWF